MQIYEKCTTETFKMDLAELCSNCPLPKMIRDGIESQIIFQAKLKHEILTVEQFGDYINAEVKNAQEVMQRVYLLEQQNADYKTDPHRANRSQTYIWNKERIKALNTFLPIKTELKGNVQRIIDGLANYKFSEFLEKKNYSTGTIYELLNEHSGKELVPHTIALLNETGFLDHFMNEYCKNKTECFKILARIFEVNERRIKGNVNILVNPNSTESETEYTSIKHTEAIRKRIQGR